MFNSYTYSVMIMPNAGPDMKYFLAFIRTQVSQQNSTIYQLYFMKFYEIKTKFNSISVLLHQIQ